MKTARQTPAVVLVHGAFVDGSGWYGVYKGLSDLGYPVEVVQNSTQSLAADVATTKMTLDAEQRPVILVGHSYGGVVITEAGHHDKVAALIYVAAFAPDKGESVAKLLKEAPPGAPAPPILPLGKDWLFIDPTKFQEAFAADVPPNLAGFMAKSQVPWGTAALTGEVGEPAWKTKRSFYLVAKDDKTIPPALQRRMAARAGSVVVEHDGSHAIYVSRPEVVVSLIQQAARSTVEGG